MNVAVIGAGVIGLSVAREIVKRKLGVVTVFEKESRLGDHASGNNSGVIHSGINHHPDSLKAKLCVRGSQMLRDFCHENTVPIKICGTWMVALNEKDIVGLHRTFEWGNASGVRGLKITSIEEMREREPLAKGIKALLSPEGAVLCAKTYLSRLRDDIEKSEGEVKFNSEVSLWKENGALVVNDSVKTFDLVINAAGVFADRYAHMRRKALNYKIVPFIGDYKISKTLAVNSMIYPVPDPAFPFLGVHLTRSVQGDILIGPGALIGLSKEPFKNKINVWHMLDMLKSLCFWKMVCHRTFLAMACHFLRMRFQDGYFKKHIQHLIEYTGRETLEDKPPGVRAQVINDKGQFVFDPLLFLSKQEIHILNVVSPGLTCSLAFSEWVVDQWLSKYRD